MTEYLTTQLLLDEGITDLRGKYYMKDEGTIQEYVEFNGTGYTKAAQLGELYHKIFGDEIIEGYFKDAVKFQEEFNEKFKVMGDDEFSPMENAVSLWGNIYKNYSNALRIFMIKESEKMQNGTLTTYQYLLDSKGIKDSLPKRIDTSNQEYDFPGLPAEVEKFLSRVDDRFAIRSLRPELCGKQTESSLIAEKQQFLMALNAIRDNIGHLKEEDIIDISYDKSSENGCATVTVNGKKINFYIDGKTYLGCKNEIENIMSPNEIGKATIGTTTEKKDMAMSRVNQDVQIVIDKENKKEGEEL